MVRESGPAALLLRRALQRFFERHRVDDAPLVVAISGGVDSTALLLALHEMDVAPLVAAHVNHHLRGDESDGDEQFVRELCASLDVPLHVADGTLDAQLVKARGIEAAAREVRHERLFAIRDAVGARFIVTAHQQNDQAETVLMRMTTGGGLAALRGIHEARADGVLRPLLDVAREDVEAYLRERNVVPRLDRSNDDTRFLRNRIRPFVRALSRAELANVAAIARQAAQQWSVLERAIDAAEDVEMTEEATAFRLLPDDAWLRQALLHRHIRRLDPQARDVSAADLERLAASVEHCTRTSVTKSLELVRERDQLILRRRRSPIETAPFEQELTAPGAAFIDTIGATIHVQRADGSAPSSRQRFVLPPNAAPHFTIRNRRRGDRLQPLGMQHEKKLKDLLIDRRIAAESRDRIPLLVWNGVIVWVANVAVSERFRTGAAPGETYEVWLDEDPTILHR